MRRPLALLPLVALVAVLAAGCGGGSSSSTSTPTAAGPQPASSSAGTGGGACGTVKVAMKNIQFAPNNVTVKKGQAVIWRNEDTVDHNVTAQSGATFKSKNFGNGGTYTFKATKAGTIKYVCTIHPGMDGTIIVR